MPDPDRRVKRSSTALEVIDRELAEASADADSRLLNALINGAKALAKLQALESAIQRVRMRLGDDSCIF